MNLIRFYGSRQSVFIVVLERVLKLGLLLCWLGDSFIKSVER